MRVEEFFHVENHSLAGVSGDVKNLGVHSDGILRAGLDTEAAVDTFSQIDDKAFGAFLDIRIRMLLGLNGDATGGADRFTHHASHATGGAVFTFREAVPGPRTRGKGPRLLRPLEGHRCGEVLEKPKTVEDVEGEVTKKMPACDTKPLQDLGKVELFPEGEFGTLHNPGLNGHAPILARRLEFGNTWKFGDFGQLGDMDFPGQFEKFQKLDRQIRLVEFPKLQAVPSGALKRVVIVVPALAEGKQGHPPEIA